MMPFLSSATANCWIASEIRPPMTWSRTWSRASGSIWSSTIAAMSWLTLIWIWRSTATDVSLTP